MLVLIPAMAAWFCIGIMSAFVPVPWGPRMLATFFVLLGLAAFGAAAGLLTTEFPHWPSTSP